MGCKLATEKLSHDIFTENLSTLIDKRGVSDAELGRQVGVSRVTIWRWRSGRQEPLGTDRDALAAALGVPVCRLYQAG